MWHLNNVLQGYCICTKIYILSSTAFLCGVQHLAYCSIKHIKSTFFFKLWVTLLLMKILSRSMKYEIPNKQNMLRLRLLISVVVITFIQKLGTFGRCCPAGWCTAAWGCASLDVRHDIRNRLSGTLFCQLQYISMELLYRLKAFRTGSQSYCSYNLRFRRILSNWDHGFCNRLQQEQIHMKDFWYRSDRAYRCIGWTEFIFLYKQVNTFPIYPWCCGMWTQVKSTF